MDHDPLASACDRGVAWRPHADASEAVLLGARGIAPPSDFAAMPLCMKPRRAQRHGAITVLAGLCGPIKDPRRKRRGISEESPLVVLDLLQRWGRAEKAPWPGPDQAAIPNRLATKVA